MRRNDIPEPLTDVRLWPSVDPLALDSSRRAIYHRREQAILAYLNGVPVADIVRAHRIDASFLSRLLSRCLGAHTDGRIHGFRGLIPHARAKSYRRSKRADRRTSHGGLSGAVGQLFERLPQLPRIIERQIGSDRLGLTRTDRLYGLTETHSRLITACLDAGLTEADYPLNQDAKGYRSFARWVRRRLEDRIPLRMPHDNGAWEATARPFSVVELDGHKLDLRLRVRFTEPSGVSVDLETERLFVITMIDVCTRAVIGWHVVPASEYDHHDVLATLQDALRPRRKRDQLTIPGLSYREGAGFVSELPELAYACWDVMKVDNAASHLTEETFTPVCEFVGCRMEAGPVGEPTGRPFIERFFLTLTDRMSRRVHGTTGRRPNDPAGKKGRQTAVDQLTTVDELEELLDVTIANYHCTPHDGLNGRTPLEALRLALAHHAVPVRTLPTFLRSRLHQLQSVHLCTVRGSVASGTAPYISLYGARYSSEVLQRTTGLLRQSVRVYPNPTDMREAWVYLTNGAELGRLSVLDGWRYSRHTLRLRRFILRQRRLGRFAFSGEQDPVQLLSKSQRHRSRRSRRDGTVMMQLAQMEAPAHTDDPSVVRSRQSEDDQTLIDFGDLTVQNR
ncbi:integrase [Paraburkholderia megapolitana]|uniref:integrase n=1 Tax=Paraburkholderia megapolitana TaxID=420953 RepID=UPI0038BD8B2E